MNKIIGSANGKKGILIWCADNKFRIRLTDENGCFEDLNIMHCDLSFEIQDEDAYIYEDMNGRKYLDHSPETLGIYYRDNPDESNN